MLAYIHFCHLFVLCFMVSNIQKHGVSLCCVFLLTDTWLVIASMQQVLISFCGLILVTTTLDYCTHISIHDYNYYCMLEMHICYDIYYSICKNIVTNKQEVWIFITWLCPLIIIVSIVQVTLWEHLVYEECYAGTCCMRNECSPYSAVVLEIFFDEWMFSWHYEWLC